MFNNSYFMKNFTIRVCHKEENIYEIYVTYPTYVGEEKIFGICTRNGIDTMVYNEFGVALLGYINGGIFIASAFDAVNGKYIYDQEEMKKFHYENLTASKSKQSQILERKFK